MVEGHMFNASKLALEKTQQVFSHEEHEAAKKIDYRSVMITAGTKIKRNVSKLKKYLKKTDLYRKLYENESQAVDLCKGDVVYFRVESFKMKSPWLLLTNYHAGGDVTLVVLPEIGIKGNTHFPMSDLNNQEIADLMCNWLEEKKLN